VLRVVQAVGAAMLQANSVALVTTSAPKERMRFALGVQAGAQSIGLALGPTLGGLLTATMGWRAVYWVNVPVGLAAIVAGRYLLPRTREFSRPERFDWPGTLLLVAWTSALLLVLSAASGLSLPAWTTALLAALALTGGLGLGLFVPANNTVIMRSTADSAASLLGGLVSMARGIGTTLGISLMALALHLGAGHGYAGSTQARPAFIVLAAAAATAAAIALVGRAQARGPAGRHREADPSGGFS
jgi:MFS family permease